jgi:hypothetical protein
MLLLLYRRLNAAYEPVILHLQGSKLLDFADAIGQLKEAKRRLQDTETLGSKGPDTALSARKQTKPRGLPPRFKVGECYYCHFTNHKRPKCPKYLKTPEGQRAYNKA